MICLQRLPDDAVEFEFEFEEPDFNLLVRLQAATTSTSATIKGTCFIGSPNFSEVERQTPFTPTGAGVSNEFAN